jgi:hypothetical protein
MASFDGSSCLARCLLALVGRLNSGHHLLFGNEMINSLEMAEQTLHVA